MPVVQRVLAAVSAAIFITMPLSAQQPASSQPAGGNAAAELTITEKVVRPADKVPPLGANEYGKSGIEWAANNFINMTSCGEPIIWRNLHRAANCGDDWFEADGGGNSWYDLWGTGFLSGANVRIYRIVDKDGNALPEKDNYLDLAAADRVILVGQTRIIPEGDKDFPDGGWIIGKFGNVNRYTSLKGENLHCTDNRGTENGRTYWYTLHAVSPDNVESDASSEASASPQKAQDTPPCLLPHNEADNLNDLKANAPWEFRPLATGGAEPLKWSVVDENGGELKLPEGLSVDPATGKISGKVAADVKAFKFAVKVADSKDKSDTRIYVINPDKPASQGKDKPQPPSELKATAGDGCVMLSWKASQTPGVQYRVKRSNQPPDRRFNRAFIPKDGPKLKKLDYIVLEKNFGLDFNMKYVHPRVRGIVGDFNLVGSSSAWNVSDATKLALSTVAHPKPPPPEMTDAGGACFKAAAKDGENYVHQYAFIAADVPGENLWWAQLEPGKHYVAEVWLMQEGLANDGTIKFSLGQGYPDISHDFKVGGEWKKYVFEFDGPPRPALSVYRWHFGPRLTFTGPGTIWMDNFRFFRCDKPEDAAKKYVPNATVLNELIASQPEKGPKGAHRIWFLARDATMASILGWHANNQVRPDWRTGVNSTMKMTAPMGLSFDLLTGDSPQTRMRPWIVLQHILHTEQDWLNFIEYMAAPYDPQKDSPEQKPWAYKRYQQRGTGTPWTDEFAQIVIEFGNETWHNGVFEDWLGFKTRNAVHQGGTEYGLFTKYLIGNIQKSPHWKPLNLDQKIKFCLGANYDGRMDTDGKPQSYGEQAIYMDKLSTMLGHANYVGPKWERGEVSSTTFDDHGVQGCLLGFLTSMKDTQTSHRQARDMIVKSRPEYDLVAYEGGPSGYTLPGSGTPPEQVAVNEKYGKSLALAVGTLDGWLASYGLGWTYQNYLGYGQGRYWSSHTLFFQDFRPHIAWLALKMRNRYASGDLMDVQETAMPTVNFGKKTYPLVGCYAMRDKNRWSVFVLSRKLGGKHDNADFGDGATPVALTLPFKKCGKITLYTLTGDPRANNTDSMAVDIKTAEIPAKALSADGKLVVNQDSGGVAGGLPQGSIFLYVFEDAAAGG
ncbi:MAG: hypothetical protein HZA50_09790 [Planctomycetes bacterium]|nr:hypothetical protein [Planctomycetota bacterium]